jgi:hypothetical protein
MADKVALAPYVRIAAGTISCSCTNDARVPVSMMHASILMALPTRCIPSRLTLRLTPHLKVAAAPRHTRLGWI